MPIKFKCPHCQKALSVKEHLAGKRAACPVCKKVLTIPAPTAAPADVEEFAASALADEPAAGEEKKPAATIDFTCAFCEAELKLSADLGGKQAPCPECRRIIKVPLPAKTDTTDWRAVQHRGPSLAKQAVEQAAPEGAWGSQPRPGGVSREALEEAGALPEEAEPITVAGWVRRGVLAAAVLGILIFGWVFLKNYWSRSLEEQALAQAIDPVKDGKSKLPPEWVAEIYRATGEFHLLGNNVEEARTGFRKARAQLDSRSEATPDRDALLIDLALSQLEMGGLAKQVEDGQRLAWEATAKEALQTLGRIQTSEARHEGVRRVCLQLIAKGQTAHLGGIMNLPDAADSTQPESPRKKPLLGALLLALLQPENAQKLLPPADEKTLPEADLATRAVYLSRWNKSHNIDQLRQFLVKAQKDPSVDRLECLLTVAAVARQQDKNEDSQRCLADAVSLITNPKKEAPIPPWLIADWALFAVDANQGNEADKLLKLLENLPELKARVQLRQYRLCAKEAEELPADSWSQAVPGAKTLAQAQALELYTRHQARKGAGLEVLKSMAELTPETLRPLGCVGVALGVQDRNR